jgi:DNA mismatch repair protein MutS2
MKHFVKYGSDKSLILIDEFGTGTEPMLGGSIAEAVLEELNRKRVFGVLTTHYTNLKHCASGTEGIINGAMAFDNHLMQPLFRLETGKPGSSFAFEIAKRIGLPGKILDDASQKAGADNITYDKFLKDIARDKRYWEKKRINIRQNEKRLEQLVSEYENELSGARSLGKDIIARAKNEAQDLLKDSNRMIENTIRKIKETQAEREQTKLAREKLEEFKNRIDTQESTFESAIDKRMSGMSGKAKKIIRKQKNTEYPEVKDKNKPLEIGDAVRMTDTMALGVIVEIKDKNAYVETGSFRIQVPPDKLERISHSELRNSVRSAQKNVRHDPVLSERKMNFRAEIDIRGVRGEEALNRVRDLIDDALMVQHKNLRILHGKGNGILRQLIREYLATVNVVGSFRDEHVDLGGSGITVVELDF